MQEHAEKATTISFSRPRTISLGKGCAYATFCQPWIEVQGSKLKQSDPKRVMQQTIAGRCLVVKEDQMDQADTVTAVFSDHYAVEFAMADEASLGRSKWQLR
jgi:hypothetical protein